MDKREKRKKAKRQTYHHECEIFPGIEPEAAESAAKWRDCQKNPGHNQFISVNDFINNHLPKVQTTEGREFLRACIDLTVGLRIHYTSGERPDDDDYSAIRKTALRRYGTGVIWNISPPKYNGFCLCEECDGKLKTKHWKFEVRTARHVVFNTEEAKKTKIDIFYDEEGRDLNAMMKPVCVVEVLERKEPVDRCQIMCVTHDQDLGDRIDSALTSMYNTGRLTRKDMSDLDLNLDLNIDLDLDPNLPWPCDEDREPVLIVSHPHGQSKKITVGESRKNEKHEKHPLVKYTTATCPGSSGAPVFMFVLMPGENADFLFLSSVHSGTGSSDIQKEGKEQINAGFDWME